jgi:transposase
MGSAVAYALNHWTALTLFIENPGIPPDNDRSESALRVVALGRKNFLFVGHEEAGQNLADLNSLVATCMANGKDPLAYLTDILGRLGSHPAARLAELPPPELVAANLTAVSPPARVTPYARAPNTSRVGRLLIGGAILSLPMREGGVAPEAQAGS